MPEDIRIEDIPHEFLEGVRKEIHQVLFQVGVDKMAVKHRVRYRPNVVEAVKIDSNHLVVDPGKPFCKDGKRKRSSGWLIEGPNDVVFYVPSEKFKEWFDIVKEK